MNAIHAQHKSMLGKNTEPQRMTRTDLPEDQREFVDNYAIAIFTDCVNSGHTFQAALSALYLSGMQNGMKIAFNQAGKVNA